MKQLKFTIPFLLTFILNVNANAYDFEVDGIYYDYNSEDQSAIVTSYSAGTTNKVYSGDIKIPKSVTYNGKALEVRQIGWCAFWQCKDLETVELPNTINSIAMKAFEECTSLKSINLPQGLAYIGYSAFRGCKSLTTINLPVNLVQIGDYAFEGCTSLKEIIIPSGEVYENAFASCTGIESIKILNKVSYIHRYAFDGCKNIISFYVEDSDVSIDVSGQQHYIEYLGKPKYLYLGRDIPIDLIDDDNVECLAISKNVSKINIYPGDALNSIYSYSTSPELISANFTGKVYSNAILYVPTGTKNKYLATEGWQNFFNIVEMGIEEMWNGKGPVDPVSSISVIRDKSLTIQAENGLIVIDGVEDGTNINVYSTNGVKTGSAVGHNGKAYIRTNLPFNRVAIVRIGEESFKISLK